METTKLWGIDRLKKMNCIRKMGEEYLSIWVKLAYKYADILNSSKIYEPVAYTYHDFSHHCKNIYVIIENVLLNNVELTEEEYFILAVSVLLHDISMTQVNFQRIIHSQQSADYIQQEIDMGVSEWKDVLPQHVPAIKEIVKAHSDIKSLDKDGNEKCVVRTLNEIAITMPGGYRDKIHVRWLAGVLRIADELDITNARLGTAEIRYKKLNEHDKHQNVSRQCWEQLNYFSNIKRNKTCILLELNETYLKTHINDDRPNIINQIKKIKKTIINKLLEVNELAFDLDDDYCNYIKIYDVRVSDKSNLLQSWELNDDLGMDNEIDEEQELGIEVKKNQYQTVQSEVEVLKDFNNIEQNEIIESSEYDIENSNLLRKELAEKIAKYIYKNGLINYGHYRLNRLFCGKEWINVRKILSDPILGRECIDVITTDLEMIMEKKNIDNLLAIGVSMNGNIMASRVAFRLGLQFTYIVPQRPGMIGSEMEKRFCTGNASKAILFTGVISSMDTLNNIIHNELKGIEILRIYTVLMRRPSSSINNEKLNKISKKIKYLNGDFPCEVIPVSQCMQSMYGKCIARNELAYEEVFKWPLAVKSSLEKRIFINNVIGCNAACQYCYLPEIGINKSTIYTFEEVKAEFERLYDVSPKENIISIGCYAESMIEENLDSMSKLIQYFAEKDYYIQISTKKTINSKWLNNIEKKLKFENQLNIYVSIPTITEAHKIEKGTDDIEGRVKNFLYKSSHKKIKMYMYIKPYLDDITEKDIKKYLDIVTKYNLDVIVGARFQNENCEADCVSVGINSMYESVSSKREQFISELSLKTNVYRHSIEPIRLYLKNNFNI